MSKGCILETTNNDQRCQAALDDKPIIHNFMNLYRS